MLWLLFTIIKIATSSLLYIYDDGTGHAMLYAVNTVVQTVILVYLVTDRRSQQLRWFAFFLGITALADYSSSLYLWKFGLTETGVTQLLLMAILYAGFNGFTVRSRAVRVLTYIYLVFTTAWVFNHETIVVAAWFTMMAAALMALDLHQGLKIMREQELEKVKRDFNALHRKYSLADARAKTIRHDMQSVLLPLEMVYAEHKTKECGTSCKTIIESVRKNIEQMMSHLNNGERTAFNARDAAENVISDLGSAAQYVDVDDSLSFTVDFNRDIFDSLVFNLVINAREAYERHNGTLVGMGIGVTGEPGRIIIRDNAGGFDYEKIAAGRSTKKDATAENGMFLHNVLDNAAAYEVSLTFSPVQYNGGKGTRVAVELL